MPLFLFHLLEYLNLSVRIDVEFDARWERLSGLDEWSQMIVKEVGPVVEQIDTAAATGQYTLEDDGTLTFRRAALDWRGLQDEAEAYFLRIYAAGDYRWKGAHLSIADRDQGPAAAWTQRQDTNSPIGRASSSMRSGRSTGNTGRGDTRPHRCGEVSEPGVEVGHNDRVQPQTASDPRGNHPGQLAK